MTHINVFGGFCARKSGFRQKQDFPVDGQINALGDKPTPESENSGRKVPTMNRSNVFFFDPMCATPFLDV